MLIKEQGSSCLWTLLAYSRDVCSLDLIANLVAIDMRHVHLWEWIRCKAWYMRSLQELATPQVALVNIFVIPKIVLWTAIPSPIDNTPVAGASMLCKTEQQLLSGTIPTIPHRWTSRSQAHARLQCNQVPGSWGLWCSRVRGRHLRERNMLHVAPETESTQWCSQKDMQGSSKAQRWKGSHTR